MGARTRYAPYVVVVLGLALASLALWAGDTREVLIGVGLSLVGLLLVVVRRMTGGRPLLRTRPVDPDDPGGEQYSPVGTAVFCGLGLLGGLAVLVFSDDLDEPTARLGVPLWSVAAVLVAIGAGGLVWVLWKRRQGG